MRALIFGSANIDRTYSVPHFVEAGETILADKMELFCGGKGFNQAIAFARAGCEVFFAGAVGDDGDKLIDILKKNEINVDYLKCISGPSGHAIIQVAPDGQNNIIVLSGANSTITHDDADRVLEHFTKEDLVVLQNEISSVDYIICRAKELGMKVALNPSPFNKTVMCYDMSKVDYLFVNEVEGTLLSGQRNYEKILETIHKKYPQLNVILTLGCEGSMYIGSNGQIKKCGVCLTDAVDTTAAGDTFTGYFLSEAIASGNIEAALKTASVASSISVSRHGASQSIPYKNEVDAVDLSCVGDVETLYY